MFNSAIIFIGTSIPVFLVLVIATISRKLTKGRSNRLFLEVLVLSFLAAIADFICNMIDQGSSLSDMDVKLILIFNYVYFFSRHAVNMLYIFYMISVTRTWFKIRGFFRKFIVAFPYICVAVLLILNPKNHKIFTVTRETGYERGEWILLLYLFAVVYLIIGVYILITRRKLLRLSEWLSLSTIYVLNIVGVAIQFVREDLMVESYFTAITLLFVVLYVQKPEIQVDLNTGLPGFFAFRDEINKIRTSGQRVQVIVAAIVNAEELRRYLGEKGYFSYVYEIGNVINAFGKSEKLNYEYYYEDAGFLYVILSDTNYNPVQTIPEIREMIRTNNPLTESGVSVDIRVVSVKFPEEITEVSDLMRFAHDFVNYSGDRIFSHASTILDQRNYLIGLHLDDVIKRAIKKDCLHVTPRPVWAVNEGRAIFAEAVARIEDVDFGEIDEATLEEISGTSGAYSLFEEYVIEEAFSYVGSGALAKDGFSYIVVKLSAVLGMQKNFTDLIWNLRSKYNVHPEHICFALRESAYANIGDTYRENIHKLSLQGYKLALDGYGKGYINIQHLSELPITSIRLDNSLITEVNTEKGKLLLQGTIRMLKSISLEVVAPKVDDEKTYQMLLDMGCELMQGQYPDERRMQIEKDTDC